MTQSGGTDKSGIAPDGEIQPDRSRRTLGRRRAAGIYGAIVTASILDTVGGHVSTAALVVSVVVTLLVYWLAEEYAGVLGAQVEGGRLPSRASIWEALGATWPMISASFAPLVALVLARLAGASAFTAANVGLVVAVLLLTLHGWLASRAAQLRGWHLFFATSFLLCDVLRGRARAGDDLAQGPRPGPSALTTGSGRRRGGYQAVR